MSSARSALRTLVHAYLAQHPAEHPAAGLAAALDAPVEAAGAAELPAGLTFSAVVIDRHRRVLHLRSRSGGGAGSLPGGRMAPGDATPLATALRELGETTGLRPGDLCLTPQLGGVPIDISTHDGHHVDIGFALHLAHDAASGSAVRPTEVAEVAWRSFDEVASPTLRAKLHGSSLDGRPRPVHASALLHNGAGRYLLQLRDNLPGIWQPGAWGLLGGGREPQDRSLLDTVRRELAEEAPGIGPLDLAPFAVVEVTGADGLCVPVQIYTGRWDGDAGIAGLTEGVLLHWFAPPLLDRLLLTESTRELVFRHAAEQGTEGRTGARSEAEDGPGTEADDRSGTASGPGTKTGDRPGTAAGTAGAVPPPAPERPASDSLEATIARLARRFTAHHTAQGLSPVEQWTLQVLKISEETGEAAQAVIGARGTNPRKAPVTWDEVHAEVADVVITALVSLKRMRPDDAEQYLRRQLALKAAKFLPGPTTPARSTPVADRPGALP